MTYSFDTQLKQGQQHERELDQYFSGFKLDSLQLKRCMNLWELQFLLRTIPNRDYFPAAYLCPSTTLFAQMPA